MVITTIFGNFPISTISSNGHFSSATIFTTKNFRFLPKQAVSTRNSAYQRASDWEACFSVCWVCNKMALQSSSNRHYIAMVVWNSSDSRTQILTCSGIYWVLQKNWVRLETKLLNTVREQGCTCLDYSHDWIITYSHTWLLKHSSTQYTQL
jgi:hypothetical protein